MDKQRQTPADVLNYPRDEQHEAVMGRVGDMVRISAEGDTPIYKWNQDVPVEVEVARECFDTWKRKGYAAFKVSRDGTKGEQLQVFDPTAKQIIFAPPMVGGACPRS
ncbi:MAG: hypothetical protein NVS3B5_22220 [Sphingomicrobium sp.]